MFPGSSQYYLPESLVRIDGTTYVICAEQITKVSFYSITHPAFCLYFAQLTSLKFHFLHFLNLPLWCHSSDFFPVLLRNNWLTSLYKFKVYSMMVWFTYIVKLLPQQVSLTFIISYRYNKKVKSIFVVRILRIYSINNFPIYHTVVLTIVIVFYINTPSTHSSYDWKFVRFDHLPPVPPPLTPTSIRFHI